MRDQYFGVRTTGAVMAHLWLRELAMGDVGGDHEIWIRSRALFGSTTARIDHFAMLIHTGTLPDCV